MTESESVPRKCGKIFKTILQPIRRFRDPHHQAIIGSLISSLCLHQHILISCSSEPETLRDNFEAIERYLEYIWNCIFNASIAIRDSSGRTRFNAVGQLGGNKAFQNASDALFMSNICIIEHFDRAEDRNDLVKVMKTGAFSCTDSNEEEENWMMITWPFIVIGLVPDNISLPKSVVMAFRYHIHMNDIPKNISVSPERPLYDTPDELGEELSSEKVYVHKEVSMYIGLLFLKADVVALVTSFLDVKSRLMLNITVDNMARLNGRNYAIPDDVPYVFPHFVTHRWLLPKQTTFLLCQEFAEKILKETPVDVARTTGRDQQDMEVHT